MHHHGSCVALRNILLAGSGRNCAPSGDLRAAERAGTPRGRASWIKETGMAKFSQGWEKDLKVEAAALIGWWGQRRI